MQDPVDEKFLQNATRVVEEHMHEADFNVELLAAALCMSRSTLYLKLKVLADQTPQVFIRSLRLERAARLLREGEGGIGDVAAKVGFLEPTHFSRSFKKRFGLSPTQYREDACGESE